jgi:hypothetical protein
MLYSSHVLWLDQRNIFKKRNWWNSLLFNLFNLPYFLPLSTKYLSRLSVLQNNLHSLSLRNETLHPHKIVKFIVPNIFILSFLYKMRRKIFWKESYQTFQEANWNALKIEFLIYYAWFGLKLCKFKILPTTVKRDWYILRLPNKDRKICSTFISQWNIRWKSRNCSNISKRFCILPYDL